MPVASTSKKKNSTRWSEDSGSSSLRRRKKLERKISKSSNSKELKFILTYRS